jgi:predicted nucleic acid-binding protein
MRRLTRLEVHLSGYDAYPDLAQRFGLSLATSDGELRAAATQLHIRLFPV